MEAFSHMSEVEYLAFHRAAIAHAGQWRKANQPEVVPYIVHPVEVWSIVSRHTEHLYTRCAALLHDVLEDSNFPITDFSNGTVALVQDLTTGQGETKLAAVSRLKGNVPALLIKMADRVSNLRGTSKFTYEYATRDSVIESTELLLRLAREENLNVKYEALYGELARLGME